MRKMNMKTKTTLAVLLSSSMLLAACGTSVQTVTEETAPNDILKAVAAINEDSTAEDVTNAMTGIINRTAEAYDYKVVTDLDNKVTNFEQAEDGTLSQTSQNSRSIDRSIADGEVMYELLEQESGDQSMVGMMSANIDTITTLYATIDEGDLSSDTQKLTVSNVGTNDSGVEGGSDMAQMVKDTVVSPLYSYMGANLIIQPMASPEYYNFALKKKGDVYEWTIDIKDKESYNSFIDNYVQENYGYERTDLNGDGSLVVDQYDTTSVSVVVSMDENGVISTIRNTNKNMVGNKDNLINLGAVQTVTIGGVSSTLVDEIKQVFADAADEKLTEGGNFELTGLTETVEQTPVSDDAADQKKPVDDQDAENASGEDEKAEDKTSSDEEKAADEGSSEESTDEKTE